MARPVVILASSRKGSWMVLSALSGHPSVFVHREQWFSHPEFMQFEPQLAVRRLYDAKTAASAIVHSQYPLPYGTMTANESLYNYLVASDAIFVFLQRDDKIRWYVSLLIARRDRQWSSQEPLRGVVPAIDVDCTAFLQAVAEDDQAYDTARHLITRNRLDCDIRDITYETLVASPFQQFQQLQKHLHLSPVPMKPTTHKQHDQPLRALIANYDEFADDLRLSGSPLARYLE